MCAILDANVLGDVFGKGRRATGKQFFDWLEGSRARLVVGGKLYDELVRTEAFETWVATAIKDGRVRYFARDEVEKEMASMPEDQPCKSDDQHIIALARVSKARVLYSDDGNLCDDFRNPVLVPKPRGRLYPSGESPNARRHRRELLNQSDLCPNR